jgi:hypothetical protein
VYHHCMAEAAADAAAWFAHARPGMARKNFQALVKDVSKPVTDESGMGGNPSVISVRHGPVTEGARNATDLQRTSALR